MSALHVSGVYILCIYVSVWCIYLVYIRECVVYISCVYACFANVRQRAFSYDEIMAFAAIEKASVHCILFMYVCIYVCMYVCMYVCVYVFARCNSTLLDSLKSWI